MTKLKRACEHLKELRYFEKQFLSGNLKGCPTLVGAYVDYEPTSLVQVQRKIKLLKVQIRRMLNEQT